MKNEVSKIVPWPKDKPVVTSKWIYKIKHAAYGSIDKYKARFVARGFSQQEGIDYEETFCSDNKVYNDSFIGLLSNIDGMEHPSNGCCYTVICHRPWNPPSRTLEGLFYDL